MIPAKRKKRRELNLRTVLKAVFAGFIALHLVQLAAISMPGAILPEKKDMKREPESILKDIYEEVKELEKREEEPFIKGEFFFDLDENPTNTEEHIVVLIYEMDDKERMVIQVTYFESEGLRDSIKYAKDIMLITCLLKSDELKIDKCDYDKKEINKILPDILKGIKEEKELYKLINRKRYNCQ